MPITVSSTTNTGKALPASSTQFWSGKLEDTPPGMTGSSDVDVAAVVPPMDCTALYGSSDGPHMIWMLVVRAGVVGVLPLVRPRYEGVMVLVAEPIQRGAVSLRFILRSQRCGGADRVLEAWWRPAEMRSPQRRR